MITEVSTMGGTITDIIERRSIRKFKPELPLEESYMLNDYSEESL